ncbi:MAG: Stp1/IreP family PP2C-type Ser/Thr phosphatase [bacterium]
MKIEYEIKTNVGKIRKLNEDNFLAIPSMNFFVVADGMGGHKCGEIASKIAVNTLKEILLLYKKNAEKNEEKMLIEAIAIANNEIYEQSIKNEFAKGMGTTITSVLIKNDVIYFANVGDSRTYLIRNSSIQQKTDDHSWVYDQVKNNLLSKEEARVHKYRNIITRALGIEKNIKADIFKENLQEGDILLLCSDGLNTMLEDEKIKNIIIENSNNLKKCCQKLIDEANNKGGEDNITIIVVKVKK